jgi:hypothetical protein
MANLNLLPSEKPKSCNARHTPKSVYGRKAYDLPKNLEPFTDDYEPAKRKYGIKVNGKWVYQPEREEKKHKAPEIMMGKYKDSCRSEGSDG